MRVALMILAVLGSAAAAAAIFFWALCRAFGHVLRDAPTIERLVMIVGCCAPALAGVIAVSRRPERTAAAVGVPATMLGLGAATAVAVRGPNRRRDRGASTAGRRWTAASLTRALR